MGELAYFGRLAYYGLVLAFITTFYLKKCDEITRVSGVLLELGLFFDGELADLCIRMEEHITANLRRLKLLQVKAHGMCALTRSTRRAGLRTASPAAC